MRTTWIVAGLVLAFGLACSGADVPPEEVVVDPEPERDGKAGKRKHGGRAPGRGGKARGAAPPDPYVAEGACPGECCAYNNVLAKDEVSLRAAPNGKEIGTIPALEVAKATTGEVHVRPTVATVKHEHTLESEEGDETVKPGDKIWVLDRGGEGWGRVWHDGGVFDAEILFAFGESCDDGEPAGTCWASVDKEPEEQVWWVKVEKQDGTVGWVDNTDGGLTGFDGCG